MRLDDFDCQQQADELDPTEYEAWLDWIEMSQDPEYQDWLDQEIEEQKLAPQRSYLQTIDSIMIGIDNDRYAKTQWAQGG